jgi:aspartyl/glutamyl-tRNA(Asn/Gln) amidotransferase C subunit
MTREEIERLATLARIEVNETEADALAKDITEILGYVAVVDEITGKGTYEKQVGKLNTVLREDGEPHEAGKYTEDLLAEAPVRAKDYIQVKKILHDER